MEEIQFYTNWDDVICPICLDFPHNGVLLQCSSYEKGCRPFVCDTDHLHSNCLDHFKQASGMLSGSQSPNSTENANFLNLIIDVLSTIHSEVPRGVVLGDYVIEYGNDNSGDEFDDFPGDDEGNWWTSCILYHVFENFRTSRNRRRSRVGDSRKGNRRLSYDTSNSGKGSVTSVEYVDYIAEEADVVFGIASGLSRGRADQRR
ncbi:Protein of unknown function (DUF1644) [Abeliophyllum distichum]|uniref:Uncharacterized protein n=1 Tax=Abeliophyllum distichum TaxID=126358 RepID=A0ABD1Q7X8_9LAMI